MIRPLSFGLVILAAGCSVAPTPITSIPSPTATNAPIALTAPTFTPTSTATYAPVGAATLPGAAPTKPPETRIIVRQTTPQPTVIAPFVIPTPATVPTPHIGWHTYVHPSLHLAVEYPPEWTVRFQDSVATFTSPQGTTIDLMPIDPHLAGSYDEFALPNTRCTNSTNSHGIDVLICTSTIGFSADAYLDLKPAGAAETAAVLSTRSRAAFDVFNAVIQSAQLVP